MLTLGLRDRYITSWFWQHVLCSLTLTGVQVVTMATLLQGASQDGVGA